MLSTGLGDSPLEFKDCLRMFVLLEQKMINPSNNRKTLGQAPPVDGVARVAGLWCVSYLAASWRYSAFSNLT